MDGRTRGHTWHLEDAAALARDHPYTFWKPSSLLVEKLRAGNLVKLIFILNNPGPDDPNAERMWVEITERREHRFAGQLTNEPSYISGLSQGDRIVFDDKHIIDADIDDPVPDATLEWAARCFATNRILEDGGKVGFLYREAPDRPEDSGWRFLCGDENEAYMESVDNIQVVSLGAVLSCDDRMVDLLDLPAPIAFRWEERENSYVIADMPTGE